jgi:signal transduction histidine kinase
MAEGSRVTSLLRGLTGEAPDLATLTGVRSGKRSYYRELQRSNERMQTTVRTMDSISRALVRTVEGPRTLVEEVLRAAAVHVQSDWMLLALTDGSLSDSRPRFLAIDGAGEFHDSVGELPSAMRRELRTIRAGGTAGSKPEAPEWVRVCMTLDGTPVGALVGQHRLADGLDQADLSVLRILANQAAVSMHTSNLYQSGLALRRRAQNLYGEVSQQARDLTVRTSELRLAELRLQAAEQRELLDAERHRIALELHDSVAQYVLSAGLAIDLCSADVARLPGGNEAATQMNGAKDLMQRASEQLRSVIYSLHHARSADDVASLPELLMEMAHQHRPHLAVALRVEGRTRALGTDVEHSLARTAGEALFNVAMHAQATRANVRLRYAADQVSLWISDDGIGNPTALRRQLRVSQLNEADGRHRGLANMAARAHGLGGTFSIRRARLGGVRIDVRVPVDSGADEHADAGPANVHEVGAS